jgi:hypothetical protein
MSSDTAAPPDQAAIAVLADRAAIANLGHQFLAALDTEQWVRIVDCCETKISVSWDDPATSRKLFSGCDATDEGNPGREDWLLYRAWLWPDEHS